MPATSADLDERFYVRRFLLKSQIGILSLNMKTSESYKLSEVFRQQISFMVATAFYPTGNLHCLFPQANLPAI